MLDNDDDDDKKKTVCEWEIMIMSRVFDGNKAEKQRRNAIEKKTNTLCINID